MAAHPCVFATFTAPSFGPVHARRMRGQTVLPCRPRRDAAKRVCPHGRDISCPVRHHPDDPRLGRPLCGDCYDYIAAVLFNACAADLWRRFTTYLPRRLARLAGLTAAAAAGAVRGPLRQGRRVPGPRRGPLPRHHPPGPHPRPAATTPTARRRPAFTADLLCDAIRQAAAAVGHHRAPRRPAAARSGCGFGTQTDARPIRHDPDLPGTGRTLSVQAVANYIAKYATKALDAPGIPARPLRTLADLDGAALLRATTGA